MPPSRRAGAHLLLMGPLEGRDRVFLMLQPSAGVVNSSGGGSTFIHQYQLPISFLAGPWGGFIWGIKVSVSRTVPHSHPRDADQYTQNQRAVSKRSFSPWFPSPGATLKSNTQFLPAEGLDDWGLLKVYGEVPEYGGPRAQISAWLFHHLDFMKCPLYSKFFVKGLVTILWDGLLIIPPTPLFHSGETEFK